jgi:hypothetical protein
MPFIGTPIDTRNQFQALQGKRFNGDGSTTAFTLDVAPSSTLDIEVFVGNVRQDPNSAYSVSGTTLTFTGAPPSGTNNIYVVHQAKSVGTIDVPDDIISGKTLVTADSSADHVLIEDATDGELKKALIPSFDTDAAVVFNESGAAVDFRVEGDTDTHLLMVDGSSDNVGIGEDVPEGKLHIFTGDASVGPNAQADELVVEGSGHAGISILSGNDDKGNIYFGDSGDDDIGSITYHHDGNTMRFTTGASEKIRIISTAFLVAKTGEATTTVGHELRTNGLAIFTTDTTQPVYINRQGNDGTLVSLRQADSEEGTISVSGGTVSYNAFAGSHWSRLADNSKPTILRGTVIESISTLMDWYQVEYTKDSKTLTKYIGALPNGKKVGDSHTITVNGVEETGVISKEDNERLPMCKISDTENSKAVYGVFMDWDGDDDTINDMYVTALGAFVVRIHKDETVAIGDYLQSKGDGTAKKQEDDILRASTIAKVTSTEKTHTYSDGSYCVPCTLHCG